MHKAKPECDKRGFLRTKKEIFKRKRKRESPHVLSFMYRSLRPMTKQIHFITENDLTPNSVLYDCS